MIAAARVARLQALFERADFFVLRKRGLQTFVCAAYGRAFFMVLPRTYTNSERPRRRSMPAAAVAPFICPGASRRFEFAGRNGPIFHDVVPGVHRRRKQVLPVIAVPERVEIQQRRRAARSADTNRGSWGSWKRPKPREEVLQIRDMHDKSPLRPSRSSSRPVQVRTTRTNTYNRNNLLHLGTNFTSVG